MKEWTTEIAKALIAPFKESEVSWVVVATTNKNTPQMTELCAPYPQADPILERLDEVVGPDGWSLDIEAAGERAAICRLTILGVTKAGAGQIAADQKTDQPFKAAATDALKTAARLMEQGANYHHITENLYKTTPQQMEFLTEIFKNVKNEQGSYVAQLQSQQFFDFGEVEASLAMEKINGLGLQNNLLVLWKSHASPAMIKGFFSSKNVAALHKINGKMKQGWVFLEFPGSNIEIVKDKLLTLIQ